MFSSDVCIAVCLSVCLSVRALTVTIFNFDEIWHRRLEPETKEPFRWE